MQRYEDHQCLTSSTQRYDFFLRSLRNFFLAFQTSSLMPITDFLMRSIFFSSSISLSWQSNFSSAVWSISLSLVQSSTKSANSPKMQSSTKSLIFPSSYESSPRVYLKSSDMQQAPISKKTAESASSTNLNKITLHLDHLTRLIIILKFPTMKRISTGKAIIVMNSYQYPWYSTRRNPTNPKQLATSVRKMLSRRMYRLKIFHLFLQSLQVVKTEMMTVAVEMAMDISAFEISLLVKTRMMFWKEMQKVVIKLRKQITMCCSFRELSSRYSE